MAKTFKTTSCPITRNQFAAVAKDMAVKLGEQPLVANPKAFSTGSLGWNANGKMAIPMTVDGKQVIVSCQVGLNITIIGSKELPQDNGSAAEQVSITPKDVATVTA